MGGFIRFIKKQHFWLIVPVLALLMGISWFLAASAEKEALKKRMGEIDGHFSSMSSVSGVSDHPNESFHKGMEQYIKQRAFDVDKAWAAQYAKQVNTVKWSPMLEADFVKEVDGLRPIEAVSEDYKMEEWVLKQYRDFIVEKELTRLAETIGSEWKAIPEESMMMGGGYGGGGEGGYGGDEGGGDGGGYGGSDPYGGGDGGGYGGGGYGGGGYGGGGYGGGEGGGYYDDEVSNIIVTWNVENQGKILATSFGWASRGSGQPSVREMLYSQEDVWVLDSLMQVIKATNGNANHSSQAVIKEIISIDIGSQAKTDAGEVSAVQSAVEDEEEGDFMMGGGMDGYGGGGYGDGASYGMDDDMEGGGFAFDPLENRYVDENYVPQEAEALRTAAASEDIGEIAVAKRMPVRIRVKMDSRKMSEVLSACANCSADV